MGRIENLREQQDKCRGDHENRLREMETGICQNIWKSWLILKNCFFFSEREKSNQGIADAASAADGRLNAARQENDRQIRYVKLKKNLEWKIPENWWQK